MFKEIHFDNRH